MKVSGQNPLESDGEMNHSRCGKNSSELDLGETIDETVFSMDNVVASALGQNDAWRNSAKTGSSQRRRGFIDNREGTEASGSKDASVPLFPSGRETA